MSAVMPAVTPVERGCGQGCEGPGCITPGVRRRLRDLSAGESDRNFAVAMHLSPFAGLLFAPAVFTPLVLWLLRRESSAFDDDHGREVINFCLSLLVWHVVTAATVIGTVLWPVLWIVAGVSFIRGACAASSGEYFRYPISIRML